MAHRICLIDDDFMVRDALATALRAAGFEVYPSPGAAAGIDLAGRMRFDAIITDVSMPGTDGCALIAEARARWPDLAILAISGYPSLNGRSPADAAEALGADATLSKPFKASQLVAAINSAMTNRGLPCPGRAAAQE